MGEPTGLQTQSKYERIDGAIDPEVFLNDVFSSTYVGAMSDLEVGLTQIALQDGREQARRETISPSSTTDENVKLMQMKLHTLSPHTEPQALEHFEHERALTIATFRLLNRLPALYQGYVDGIDHFALIKEFMFKIDGLIASDEKTIFWRQPVYDKDGKLLNHSYEERDRRHGYKSNPDGKVSEVEFTRIVLPRVISILKSMTQY